MTNSGYGNSGGDNSGDWNLGDGNSGDYNSGNRNSGDGNSGNRNSGDENSGYMNSGNWNSGNWNSGNRNSGDGNSGCWNSGDRNSGYCNSATSNSIFVFNKPLKTEVWDDATKPSWMFARLASWVAADDMTDKDKKAHPSHMTTDGYLQVFDSLQHAYIEAWSNASDEDKKNTLKLPNYDREVFIEVFGFDPEAKEEEITLEEMTLEEVCRELGRDVKIIK